MKMGESFGLYSVTLFLSGWAYDLKTVSDALISRRAARSGDGIPYKYSRCVQTGNSIQHKSQHHDESSVWGWDDKDMDQFDKDNAHILRERKML